MSTILTYNLLQQYKPCGTNNAKVVAQLIQEVEMVELPKLIGKDTYKSIMNDANKAPIPNNLMKILEGGLYACISYLVYARYLEVNGLIDTPTGFVYKTRQDSETASVGVIRNEVTKNKEIASSYYDLVKDDLDSLYKVNNCVSNVDDMQVINIRKNYKINRNIFDSNYFD